jgi:hypothetical protein
MRNNVELRQEKFAMIERWQQSGLSAKGFCLQNNIAYSVFQYWQKKYRQDNSAEEKSSAFLQLNVSAAPGAASGGIEVIWPDGKRILFHQPVSSHYLKSIIS